MPGGFSPTALFGDFFNLGAMKEMVSETGSVGPRDGIFAESGIKD